ncbi:MAG: hypothetical protein COB53_03540 [Elusimicrobia bacterium]|nr:MAG: hypothetical protein COB53_03540 [Elusimicrobiota bacterium]
MEVIYINVTLTGTNVLDERGRKYPKIRKSIKRWRNIIKTSTFLSGNALTQAFGGYDYVPPRCHVFNLSDGFRLIALIDFTSRIVVVDEILSHPVYEKWECV